MEIVEVSDKDETIEQLLATIHELALERDWWQQEYEELKAAVGGDPRHE